MKKKLATVWIGGCSGCHMSLLDIDERILDVVALADIVKSPIVDGKNLPEVDITLVEGAVVNDEHIREAEHIRKQSKIVISLGDCAVTANVPAYRNLFTKEETLRRAYVEAESNDSGLIPDSPQLGKLIDHVKPLHEVIHVDYFIPGCPPSADLIFYVLGELLNGRVPAIEEGRLKYG